MCSIDTDKERTDMVNEQLKRRGITNQKVLEVMACVPRHLFVPTEYKDLAYTDRPLPIGEDQTISQPYIVALTIETLDVRKDNRILEIGTGSGYQTAILSYLAQEVYSIERIGSLLKKAKERLGALKITNVFFRHGDGSRGWPGFAPFDRIVLSACSKELPGALLDQLGCLGKMVLPMGEGRLQWLTLVDKQKNGLFKTKAIVPCVFVPLIKD